MDECGVCGGLGNSCGVTLELVASLPDVVGEDEVCPKRDHLMADTILLGEALRLGLRSGCAALKVDACDRPCHSRLRGCINRPACKAVFVSADACQMGLDCVTSSIV